MIFFTFTLRQFRYKSKPFIMTNVLIKNIVKQLQDVQDGDLWLDETFAKKIDLLTEEQALTRPIPEMHSVAEIISHLLEWRKGCMLKLQGEKAHSQSKVRRTGNPMMN